MGTLLRSSLIDNTYGWGLGFRAIHPMTIVTGSSGGVILRKVDHQPSKHSARQRHVQHVSLALLTGCSRHRPVHLHRAAPMPGWEHWPAQAQPHYAATELGRMPRHAGVPARGLGVDGGT